MDRTVQKVNFLPKQPKALRVAAYARVSSGKEAMLDSLSAQVSYYNSYIQEHPGWLFCGVYSDEAQTGTRDDREGFQRLLAACRAKEIDLVVTKSISRLARNTVTLLSMVRELSALGVNVYFERENLYSMGGEGEMMLAILASFAQEESRSASENQKWRVQANFKEGLPWNGTVLGYRIVNGVYVPVEDEDALVKEIFKLYINGWGVYKIAKHLNKLGYRTRKGNEWSQHSLYRLLTNYSYTGNLLLQTTFVEDHITKRKRINRGELPMYHAENSHKAIIPMADFETAQQIRKERAITYRHDSDHTIVYPFRGKLHCMCCGKGYRRKMARRGAIWICGTYNSKGKEFCPTSKAIPEDTLMTLTAKVMGVDNFDGDLFRETIDRIEVGSGNKLAFKFMDGSTVVTVWEDHSRRDSWTEEKRDAARQVGLRQALPDRDESGRFLKKDKEELK